ncbi:MAG: glycoside hydrolase family 97 protein [Chitinophagales bacterium]
MKSLPILFAFLFFLTMLRAQKSIGYDINSPDGNMALHVSTGGKMEWSVQYKGEQIIVSSPISLQLESEVLGNNAYISASNIEKKTRVIDAINYFKAKITDEYNQLTLQCKGDYGVIFRVYNDAVAYRFFTKKKGKIIVRDEEANFNFTGDQQAFIPIQWDYRAGKIFNSSFEALYHDIHLSQFPKDSLAFLPILVSVGQSRKVAILEADLEDYPGMYLDLNRSQKGLKAVFAPYPTQAHVVGINYIPTERADYIALTEGTRSFPWRAVIIAEQDKNLLNNDLVQKLASDPRLTDFSWVKPGQVAWDWWNDWNITGVDFKAGINTPTYKYYIDFAAANKIPYIIMDAGWSNELDMTKINPDVNIQEIADYGKQKNVGVILWATWYAIQQQMETVFPLYSKMGIKGFKIDFFDRDDQIAVASTYEIAKKAAEYKLIVDFHGIFKPTGLPRTYPNVISYEGVKGLENFKWAMEDAPRYACSVPFIRMLAGPMDYTPGAMRNATRAIFRPINDDPMSQGTRCHQLAEYVVFYAPLQMLSDNPSIYMKEQECTDFITSVPTIFDETVPLDGKVGEYVAIARRKGADWFVGAMSNWTPHELTIDFSFLLPGQYDAVIFKDGVNADRKATDYKREVIKISSGDKIKIQLSNGGGWVARISKE